MSSYGKEDKKGIYIFEFDKDEVMHRTIKIEMNVTNKDKERVENHILNHFHELIDIKPYYA